MRNVMVDLETLGIVVGSVILSVGAVEFGPEGLGRTFYVEANRLSSELRGFVTDPATEAWWAEQGDEARGLLARTSGQGGISVEAALLSFGEWLTGPSDGVEVAVWGNGAAFDNALLVAAYERCDLPRPWPFWCDRCYRTLKNLRPDVPHERSGVHHHALDDARTQALHAVDLLRTVGFDWS